MNKIWNLCQTALVIFLTEKLKLEKIKKKSKFNLFICL